MAKQPNTPKGNAGKVQPPDNASPDGAPDAGPGTIPAAEVVKLPDAANGASAQTPVIDLDAGGPAIDPDASGDTQPVPEKQYTALTVIRWQGEEYQPGAALPAMDDKTIDELLAHGAIG